MDKVILNSASAFGGRRIAGGQVALTCGPMAWCLARRGQ